MEPLPSTTNRFGGVLPDPGGLPSDAEEFARRLGHSLELWRSQGLRLVWLEIATRQSCLVPLAVEAGFAFHHVGPDYLMLTRPLEEGTFTPGYSTHYIGAGGVVLNAAGELLVVCERYFHTPGQPPRYKLPGGALHPREHLVDGVIREVREETGIETRFEALVCLRHWHEYRYGQSDIYFICRLRPLGGQIRRQEEEIFDCRWMPVEEYLAAPSSSPFNRQVVRAALASPGLVPVEVEGYEERGRYEVFLPPADGRQE
ncbi:MAG: NUDIX domain-containing protein [Candidatus Latescibacterota bacterium]